MERKPAVAVVFHHIGPYHHARLNAAADRFSVTGIEWSGKAYDHSIPVTDNLSAAAFSRAW